jgi:hypothetical protein
VSGGRARGDDDALRVEALAADLNCGSGQKTDVALKEIGRGVGEFDGFVSGGVPQRTGEKRGAEALVIRFGAAW